MASTTPDLSEFFKYSQPKRKACSVAFARQQLSDTDRDALDAAVGVDRGLITNAAVRDWLKARGHAVNDAAISAHRRGVCSCGRD